MSGGAIPAPSGLVVLPQAIQEVACSCCQRLGARWARTQPDGGQSPVCAWCLVYASEWGAAYREDLDRLLALRAASRGESYPRDEEGRISDRSVLDLILGAVVLPHRLAERKRGS